MDRTRFHPNPALHRPRDIAAAQYKPKLYLKLAKEILQRCIDRSWEMDDKHTFGTLYHGSLGPRVYGRWRLYHALRKHDKTTAMQLLHDALQEVEQCIAQQEEEGEQQQHTSSSPQQRQRRRPPPHRVSLLEGAYVGARAMHAVLLYDSGRTTEALQQALDLAQLLRRLTSELPSHECDVLYGRAGALQVILFLRKHLQSPHLAHDTVVQIATDILEEGSRYAATHPDIGFPLLWKWHDSLYLGAAHGVVGILQTLLSLPKTELEGLPDGHDYVQFIHQTIDELDSYCYSGGNLQSRIRVGEPPGTDRLVHWCHGAPGHVLLLMQAAEVYGDCRHLERAKHIAEAVVWHRGLLRKGVGLCHGISGSVYALLAAGRADPSLVHKAAYFVDFAMKHVDELELVPDHPYSVFEGMAGLGILCLDMVHPSSALFPLYEY
jgi:hypothetical protein